MAEKMKVTSQHHNYDRQDGEDSFDFKSLILKYLAAWPWFLYSIGGALLLAFAVNQLTPPEYKIQSKFLIREDDKGMELFNTEAAKDIPPPKGQKLANGSIIIKSRSLAESALDRLNFDVEYYEEGLLSDAEIYRNAPLQVEVDWSHPQLTNGKMKITWDDHNFYQLELQDKEFTQYAPGESMPVIVEPASLPAKKYPFGHWIDFPEGRLKVNLKSIEESGSLIIRLRDRESLILQYTGDDLQVVPADKISSILLLTLDTREPYKGSEYLNTLMQVFLENE
ncbi:MAG TPA: capsular biosynthesis protein, partial [Chryseosolibacter sp.]